MITSSEIESIYNLSLMDLVHKAHEIHRNNFDPHQVQKSHLLSIKTGGCPEDCAYCPQSAHYKTGLRKESLMAVSQIVDCARTAKEKGATRFCMGAAWREVKDGAQFDQVLEAVRGVKGLELEVCCTLGMVSYEQACRLKEAGLYAYNHNIDTSDGYYSKIISTRKYEQRLNTIQNVRKAGLTVCTGGILGMGERDEDRIVFIRTLANLDPQPESVTINTLVSVKGTPLESMPSLDPLVLVRTIATCRIFMPKSMIRLSAGRNERSQIEQLLCFYVGANSIFVGEKLLTSSNPNLEEDSRLFKNLNLESRDDYALNFMRD